jgi:hypothetical protein
MINPDHLLQQADKLIASSKAGRPRQADLRRAVSAAYYAVFHSVLAAAADNFVGPTKRREISYGLAYRRVDHRWLRELCSCITKTTMPTKFQPFQPAGGFGSELRAFSGAVGTLQKARHDADYDPLFRLGIREARNRIALARSALSHLDKAPQHERVSFLSLLLFEPR